MTQARITVKKSGPLSISIGGRKYKKGRPVTLTDVGDIRTAQEHSALDVKIVKGSMPKAPPTSEPPPPPADPADDPSVNTGRDEGGDDDGEGLGLYTAEDLDKQTKAELVQLAEEEFEIELPMSDTKDVLVQKILDAQASDDDDATVEGSGDDDGTSEE